MIVLAVSIMGKFSLTSKYLYFHLNRIALKENDVSTTFLFFLL